MNKQPSEIESLVFKIQSYKLEYKNINEIKNKKGFKFTRQRYYELLKDKIKNNEVILNEVTICVNECIEKFDKHSNVLNMSYCEIIEYFNKCLIDNDLKRQDIINKSMELGYNFKWSNLSNALNLKVKKRVEYIIKLNHCIDELVK